MHLAWSKIWERKWTAVLTYGQVNTRISKKLFPTPWHINLAAMDYNSQCSQTLSRSPAFWSDTHLNAITTTQYIRTSMISTFTTWNNAQCALSWICQTLIFFVYCYYGYELALLLVLWFWILSWYWCYISLIYDKAAD